MSSVTIQEVKPIKSLLVLRHAEAISRAPGGFDQHRQLTANGEVQARQLGELLLQRDINPDRIFCSAAVRAQQTADQVAAAARWSAAVVAVDGLYNASAAELMAPASAQAHEITQVCLVAHVPGVANLVSLLTTKHVDLAVNYGPATLAEVILDIDEWSQIGPGTGFLHLLLAQ